LIATAPSRMGGAGTEREHGDEAEAKARPDGRAGRLPGIPQHSPLLACICEETHQRHGNWLRSASQQRARASHPHSARESPIASPSARRAANPATSASPNPSVSRFCRRSCGARGPLHDGS
jgi:hypothetical protein